MSKKTVGNVCSLCGAPTRTTDLVVNCRVCGYTRPTELNIAGNTHTLSRKTKLIVAQAKRLAKLHGIEVDYLLSEIKEKPVLSTTWMTYMYFGQSVFKGMTDTDIERMPPTEVEEEVLKKSVLQVRIPVHLHKWFRKHTEENDTNMSEVLLAFITRLHSVHTNATHPEQF